jgi:hypothetical protein
MNPQDIRVYQQFKNTVITTKNLYSNSLKRKRQHISYQHKQPVKNGAKKTYFKVMNKSTYTTNTTTNFIYKNIYEVRCGKTMCKKQKKL